MSIRRVSRIYLLTVWQEDEESWRFLLEDPRSGKRCGFATVKAFVDGLIEVFDVEKKNSDATDSAPSPGC